MTGLKDVLLLSSRGRQASEDAHLFYGEAKGK
jgi:hypothetical protein